MSLQAAVFLGATLLLMLLAWRLAKHWLDKIAARTVHRFGARVDRFKLTRKRVVIEELLRDRAVIAAARAHASEHALDEQAVMQRVRGYLNEIIPFFNILAYYRIGYVVSRTLLNLFYKVSVHYERPDPFRSMPKDAIVLYLMNHRSNADYVLVSYALAGDVAISYAVGEWARAFPLEYIFKAFGAYFIRRRYREPLYHAVLERYVQLITEKGVTQGIFPEGGLTRDGTLRPAKIGLLDYVLGVARSADSRSRLYVVPVAINYDRVIEDRSLLRELATQTQGAQRPSYLTQIYEVLRYVGWNILRLVTRRWKRYGRAALVIGEPWPVEGWFAELETRGVRIFELTRHERLRYVQAFADRVMHRIGQLMPVTSVTLTCAALETFASEYIERDALLERIADLREVLVGRDAFVIRHEFDVAETFDRAYRMLRMRRIVARQGTGYLVLPKGRALIHYYANSIRHLYEPYFAGVVERDEPAAYRGIN
ncbi:MAG TPA: 1-acyl-sn-glycerol-3-phosphate acyltransferase [Gemmatimonadaceae bacterium]|jgi:glycerol-3-phosphate O-acyltransferase